jgi:hypothetical protein
MNDKQKLLIMVGTGSLLVLLITIFGLGFNGERWDFNDKIIVFDFTYFFKKGKGINWLGIVASFNITFCITGYFLFKDK